MLAGDLELLADVNAVAAVAGLFASNLTAVGPVVYFTSSDQTHGSELWKSNGTPEGTVLVKDIFPGTGNSNPSLLTNVNGELYFTASDGLTGIELWKSDGTETGTVRVKDVRPGAASSTPRYLTNLNGSLLFVTTQGVTGNELWQSDGTETGTTRIANFTAFPGRLPSFNRPMTVVDDYAYFTANDGVSGFELWKSDGTAAGTQLVKDIFPGSGSSLFISTQQLISVNAAGTLYFIATDGMHGAELWKSDGTAANTGLVKDIHPGSTGSVSFFSLSSSLLANVGEIVYFPANDGATGSELWRSDGTEAGTMLVSDIAPGVGSSLPTQGTGNLFTTIDGVIYFAASEATAGSELWKSDGTPTGTVRVKDISAGTASSVPRNLTSVGGLLYFVATESSTGFELWRSDGTEAGTRLVADLSPGSVSSSPASLTNLGGQLYFIGNGRLYRSDGTEAGTLPVVRVVSPTSASSNPVILASAHGHLYFSVQNGSRFELWRSNGTPSGTSLVPGPHLGGKVPTSGSLKNVGGTVYFVGVDDSTGYELWKIEGATSAPELVKDITPGTTGPVVSNLTEVSGAVYFSLGAQLWKSDGTEAGTTMIQNFVTGGPPLNLVNVNGVLYFTPLDSTQLWRTDGTTAGTYRVDSGSSTTPRSLTNVNGTLFFSAFVSGVGRELWKTNSTGTGIELVKDLFAGANSSNPSLFVSGNGVLYFSANDGFTGFEIWKSDGSAQGTVLVRDIVPGATSGVSSYFNTGFVESSGALYFTASNGANGNELWKTDGTEAGTVQVKDIFPGPLSSSPTSLANIGGILYFSASDGVNGQELWRSDGTEAGTYLVQDLTGDSGGSTPVPFDFNGRLVVIATTEATGRELFIEIIPGDFNRDNTVDAADYTFWRDNFGATTAPGLRADANRDGVVDGADYTVWRDNYSPPPTASIASALVSKPLVIPSPPRAHRKPQLVRQEDPLTAAPQTDDFRLAAKDAAFAELATNYPRGSDLSPRKSAPRKAPREILAEEGFEPPTRGL